MTTQTDNTQISSERPAVQDQDAISTGRDRRIIVRYYTDGVPEVVGLTDSQAEAEYMVAQHSHYNGLDRDPYIYHHPNYQTGYSIGSNPGYRNQ